MGFIFHFYHKKTSLHATKLKWYKLKNLVSHIITEKIISVFLFWAWKVLWYQALHTFLQAKPSIMELWGYNSQDVDLSKRRTARRVSPACLKNFSRLITTCTHLWTMGTDGATAGIVLLIPSLRWPLITAVSSSQSSHHFTHAFRHPVSASWNCCWTRRGHAGTWNRYVIKF